MTARATALVREPWRSLSGVRLRILGWLVALIILAELASVLIERRILLDQVDAEVEASLTQEVEEIRSLAGGRDPNTGQPFGDDVAAIFDTFLRRNIPAEGESLFTFVAGRPYKATRGAPYPLDQEPALVARWSRLTGPEQGALPTPAGRVRYRAVPLPLEGDPRGVFVVANFLAQERREVLHAVEVEALVALSVLLAAAALAWMMAGRVLRPLRVLTDMARCITETDLTRRIPVKGNDEIAQLTATFNAMLDRLEEAFATQRAFLDDVSHELRAPITIIRGHLEVLTDDPKEQAETIELVIDELERMTRLVGDLLLLAKAERPDFLQPEPIDLAAFTAELHAKAVALAPRDWKVERVASALVRGDRQRLTQAVMNLLRNAAQHTGEDDLIAIGSSVTGDQTRLWVHDTGAGVDPADHERVFRRFVRVTGRHRSDGAGLGLAIALAIVEAHGGRIELDSRAGAGATFTIVLPTASPPEGRSR